MPTKPPVKKPIQPLREDDFKSVAKRLGCDENKAAFEKNLGKLAKATEKKGK